MIYYVDDNNIFFYSCVLGILEKYLETHDHIKIKTKKDCANILKLLFNEKIIVDISDINEEDISFFEYFNVSTQDKYNLKKRINYNDVCFDNIYEKFDNVVCVCVSDGFFSNVKRIIIDTFLYKKYKIINIYDIDNIYEIIYLLNKCLILFTDSLEYLQMGYTCNTNNIAFVSDTIQNNECYDGICGILYNINFSDTKSIPKFRMDFLKNNNLLLHKKKQCDMKCTKNDPIYEMPYVSCVCPTYNRAQFLPFLINMFNNQDYPKDLRELIILDDSNNDNYDNIKHLFIDNNIKYYHINTKKKLSIGKKRNLLHQFVSGEYIICFDDDDYYPPNRISHAISIMKSSNVMIAGSSKMHIYYVDLNKIYEFGPYGINHATNGTLAYHRNLSYTNFYDDNAESGEEKIFLNNYSEKMVQLCIENTILCISHGNNTYDKKKIINFGKHIDLDISFIIKDKEILDFYKSI